MHLHIGMCLASHRQRPMKIISCRHQQDMACLEALEQGWKQAHSLQLAYLDWNVGLRQWQEQRLQLPFKKCVILRWALTWQNQFPLEKQTFCMYPGNDENSWKHIPDPSIIKWNCKTTKPATFSCWNNVTLTVFPTTAPFCWGKWFLFYGTVGLGYPWRTCNWTHTPIHTEFHR